VSLVAGATKATVVSLCPAKARCSRAAIARRLAALILLQPELDANYQRVKAATHDWKQ
jgi:hypothetical protein